MNRAVVVRIGDATYAGNYRIVYLADGSRYLEIRKAGGFSRLNTPIPQTVRGAYNAANFFNV